MYFVHQLISIRLLDLFCFYRSRISFCCVPWGHCNATGRNVLVVAFLHDVANTWPRQFGRFRHTRAHIRARAHPHARTHTRTNAHTHTYLLVPNFIFCVAVWWIWSHNNCLEWRICDNKESSRDICRHSFHLLLHHWTAQLYSGR